MLAEVKSWLAVGVMIIGLLAWRSATRGDSPVDQLRADPAAKSVIRSLGQRFGEDRRAIAAQTLLGVEMLGKKGIAITPLELMAQVTRRAGEGIKPSETYTDAVAAVVENAGSQSKITLVSHKESSYHRACLAADLVGLWKVVQWTTYIDKANLNSYGHPHQWYWFSADGALRSMTSTKPNENVGEIAETLGKLPAVISYSCAEGGKVATTRKDSPNGSELWAAFVVTQDKAEAARNVDLKRGDVVMTLLGKEGRPLYVRQMRKLAVK